MIIFIDESGDAGFRLKKGSSQNFVVALVIFDDDLDAEETALKIKKLKRKLGKKDTYEFKFNKCSKDFRIQFLKAIKNSKFRVRAIVIKKNLIYSKNLRDSKDNFYSFIVKEVFQYSGGTIQNAKVRLDGLGERAFRRNLTAYLRRELKVGSKSMIQDLKFRNSNSDVLIQLADMIAGAIRRSYDSDKTDRQIYKELIEKRIEDIWEFQ